MDNVPAPYYVRTTGSTPALVISDADPVDAELTENAVKMLAMARTLLTGPGHDMGSGELRYMAGALCQSLADVLDVMGVERR